MVSSRKEDSVITIKWHPNRFPVGTRAWLFEASAMLIIAFSGEQFSYSGYWVGRSTFLSWKGEKIQLFCGDYANNSDIGKWQSVTDMHQNHNWAASPNAVQCNGAFFWSMLVYQLAPTKRALVLCNACCKSCTRNVAQWRKEGRTCTYSQHLFHANLWTQLYRLGLVT